MTEIINGRPSYEERLAAHLEKLRRTPAKTAFELAAMTDKEVMDDPVIDGLDPARLAAARQLVSEARLEDFARSLLSNLICLWRNGLLK